MRTSPGESGSGSPASRTRAFRVVRERLERARLPLQLVRNEALEDWSTARHSSASSGVFACSSQHAVGEQQLQIPLPFYYRRVLSACKSIVAFGV